MRTTPVLVCLAPACFAPACFALACFAVAACGETPAPVPPVAPPPRDAGVALAAPTNDGAPSVRSEQDLARDKALAPRAAAVVDVYDNAEVSLSSDGKRVAFGSDRGGVPGAFLSLVDRPADPPIALTHGPERALWPQFTRDDKFVVFHRDEGADENFGIWRVAPDGSGTTLLTPGAKERRKRPLLPRKKPDLLVYTTHVTTSPASKLVFQPISGGPPRVVYEDPAPARTADVTADASRVLLTRRASASESVLVEVDVARGKPPARVYPPEGARANIRRAAYAADAKVVFVATDEGREGFALLALDAATHATKARWAVDEPRFASIDMLAVSPKGDLVAVSIDAGDHTEIRLLDAKTLAPRRKLDLPLGSGGMDGFTADGKALAFGMSTADRPTDVYLADVATGATRLLREDARPLLDTMPKLDTSIVKVKAHDGLDLPVAVYRPAALAGQKLPVIALFHGGPSESSQVGWDAYVRFFTALGYAVLQPNIRGSTGFGRAFEMADDREKRGDAIQDLATINAWVKAEPWADPSRVIIMGGSYGGYLTLMGLTRQPALWRAGVSLAGVSDSRTLLATGDQTNRALLIQEFGDLEKDAALLDAYSPGRDVDKIAAPLFLYAGQNDPRVPRAQSDRIVAALRGRGVPVEYMVSADEGHSLDRRENRIEFMTRVARFLDDHAK